MIWQTGPIGPPWVLRVATARRCPPRHPVGLLHGVDMIERQVPHDEDAEEQVLAAMLIYQGDDYFKGSMNMLFASLEPNQRQELIQQGLQLHKEQVAPKVRSVASRLKPEHFYRDRNGWNYRAMRGLLEQGVAVNRITVAHALAQQGKLEACGGAAFLAHLDSIALGSSFIEDYAQIVYEHAQKRGLIRQGKQLEEQGYSTKALPPVQGRGGIKLPEDIRGIPRDERGL